MDLLINLDPDSELGLQHQIRQKIVEAILSGIIPAGQRIMSSRKLAKQLNVARNTVVLAYNQLVDEGYLESRERSGLYVNQQILNGRVSYAAEKSKAGNIQERWSSKIKIIGVGHQRHIWPGDWQNHPYPFIDGYFDASLYPVAQWQEASRLAFGGLQARQLHAESDADDAMLVEEIRTKILPRRGINAGHQEILITSGSHHALYLLANLLTDSTTVVSMEDPGDPALRSCLALTHCKIRPQPIDENGMIVDERLDKSQIVYVTPSHQKPTGVTMPLERRKLLLEKVSHRDQILIEDDSESERNYFGNPKPAIQSLDQDDRVIYISALPKAIAPGLGLGFIVASPTLIAEARRLRRLMVGNPPRSNQRTAAFFISLGHYDAFMVRIHKVFSQRWNALRDALNHYLPQSILTLPNQGGTAFWVKCPSGVSVEKLVQNAGKHGILIEPVGDYYSRPEEQDHCDEQACFRMGVTSIDQTAIRDGVEKLAQLIRELSGNQQKTLEQISQTPLSGEQIFNQLAGATLICKTVYGAPCTIELRADGKMLGRAGHADEEYDQGRWWIENDIWYRQWESWAYGEQAGYYITIENEQISWFNQNGRLVDTAIIKLAPNHNSKLV
ncbi:PLP-dependent aminotransferase family protein [Aliikangiella sp. G2MR2-5]|uniref:MocR-like pyridoxine biosynthesis transcription factor PdxR n=1 Tax=Aliikangiella sp. G2MR2-5 TaxID=2788943 RepID=UPI0018AC8744|nr:PLP-dependent aminotransferase family protein [Aliikangiella sp. G2MR2-5]